MKLSPLPKLQESRLGQIWFVFFQIAKFSWQASPKLLIFTLIANTTVGFLIYPTLRLEKAFIDNLIKNVGSNFWGAGGQFVILVLFLRFVIGLTQDTLTRIAEYCRRMMSRILDAYLATLMAKKNAELDMVMLDSPDFKDKFSKIERESSRRAWGMMYPLVNMPMVLAGLLSTLVIIFSFYPGVVLVILVFSIPIFLVDARYIRREYQFEDKMNPLYRIWGWLDHYLLRPRNALEIKLLRLSQPFSERMQEIYNKIFLERIKLEKQKTLWKTIVPIPQNIFLFLVGVYLAFLVFAAKLSVGSAEMILRAITSFRENLTALVSNFLELYENYLYVTDFVWLLSLKPSIEVSGKGEKIGKRLKKGIEFKNVWFRYTEKGPWILKDINLHIKPEENIAVVGENGVGKSTLVKLICRFYDPQKGKIFLNGIELKKYSVESLWNNLSVLFQDFETYPFTARESIVYGDITKIKKTELIKKAAKKAEIDDFIESLPLRYENPLDPQFEKGVRPSFGQWQRIGLARVFLKDARIVILDEPTSYVDSKAEEQIFREIIRYSKRKILILISHRFSTVRQAGKIYVLDKGKIIEEGSHEDLVRQKGTYAELFNLQARSYQ